MNWELFIITKWGMGPQILVENNRKASQYNLRRYSKLSPILCTSCSSVVICDDDEFFYSYF